MSNIVGAATADEEGVPISVDLDVVGTWLVSWVNVLGRWQRGSVCAGYIHTGVIAMANMQRSNN